MYTRINFEFPSRNIRWNASGSDPEREKYDESFELDFRRYCWHECRLCGNSNVISNVIGDTEERLR